jgi:hypothetical protein
MNENHKRAISVRLALLDEALYEIELWAKGREVRSVLYKEHNTFSPAQREQVLAEIENIRKVLKDILETLLLEGKVRNVADSIWSCCLSFQEQLVELEGKYLRRYGEFPQGFSDYLDPLITEIIKRLQHIAEITRGMKHGS